MKGTIYIRLSPETKKKLDEAAKTCRRPNNTELIVRLMFATDSFGTSPVELLPEVDRSVTSEMRSSWIALRTSIDRLLSARVIDVGSLTQDLAEKSRSFDRQLALIGLIEGSYGPVAMGDGDRINPASDDH